MTRFGGVESPVRYSKSYFFEDYKRQYGRTYLEDWPALTRMADARLALIEAVAAKNLGRRRSLAVVDIGCAYGPFLARARERGHEVRGLDVSEEAVAYVRGELGVFAVAGDFLDQGLAAAVGGPFDVLSMWYVVEHFDDVDMALRNAASLVKPGGVLALSTPSAEGASALFARDSFFASSPRDHFSLWEPSRVRSLLRTYGFRVEKIRITGHHPERLPGLRFLARRGAEGGPLKHAAHSLLSGFGRMVSRVFGLGDTFEVYAVRDPALAPWTLDRQQHNRGRRASDREDQTGDRSRGRQGRHY
jgi:SAM-dependent methyltransferase